MIAVAFGLVLGVFLLAFICWLEEQIRFIGHKIWCILYDLLDKKRKPLSPYVKYWLRVGLLFLFIIILFHGR